MVMIGIDGDVCFINTKNKCEYTKYINRKHIYNNICIAVCDIIFMVNNTSFCFQACSMLATFILHGPIEMSRDE